MARRKHNFASGEYYHCYNRGTDKRNIFQDKQDFHYFLKSLKAYNSFDVTGKLRLHKKEEGNTPVDVITYALLPNHFHLLLKSNVDNGVSKFLQRVSIGYTMYFNNKNDRSGILFQGPFKSVPISNDQSLRQVYAYVINNNKIHSIENSEKYRTSAKDYLKIVRDPYSNFDKELSEKNATEIVEIIKNQRLGLE